jgi:hypothetical protein
VGFPDGNLRLLPACRPGPNLPEERNKAGGECDLRDLIFLAVADVAEKVRRERLRRHLESGQSAPAGIGNVQPRKSGSDFCGDGHQPNDIGDPPIHRPAPPIDCSGLPRVRRTCRENV